LVLLSVLIVTHNSDAHIGDCLRSLLPAVAEIPSEIVVVDNASSDGTVDLVKGFAPARVVALPQNRGFASGIKAGLAATTGSHVLWLNPDSRFVSGRIADVIAWMDAHPEAGIVGGKILDPAGTVQLSARGFPSYGAVLGARYSILTKLFPKNP